MITERLQRAAIWQLSNGQTPDQRLRPDTFEEPWRTVYRELDYRLKWLVDNQDPDNDATPLEWAIMQAAVVPASSYNYWELIDEIIDSIRRADRQYKPRTLTEVASSYPPVEWLWNGWLPRGMLSLLAGDPGSGKSHWTLDLVRTLQRGGTWPDGAACTETGATVWIEGEGIAQEIAERAVALGLNADNIYMTSAPDGEILNLLDKSWQDEVVNLVATVKPALIVVDSLSTITDKGQDRSEQVTPLLLWLVGLARWSNASVLLIHHLRKSSAQSSLPLRVTLDQIRGSGQIAAQARAIIAMSHTSTERDQPRLLDLLKKTISRGRHPKPLSVAAVRTEDGEMICRFEYGDAPKLDGAASRDECADWLLDLLADGPMRLSDIIDAGEENGYNKSMIWRTRKGLNGQITDTEGRQNPRNRWALTSWSASEDADEEVL